MTNIYEFKGIYELVEKYSVRTDDTVIYPWGKEVKGILIYTDDFVSAQLGKNKRSDFNNSDFRNANQTEVIEAFTSYISYFGTYEVKSNYLIHNIQQSLFPNWIGKKVKRFFKFDGEFLFLEAMEDTKTSNLTKTVLKWKRLH